MDHLLGSRQLLLQPVLLFQSPAQLSLLQTETT
jgi:hypothetical protein